MSTSGTRTYIQTRDDVINMACRAIGVLGLGDTATTEMINEAVPVLHAMVFHWQNDKIFLWERDDDYETIVAATASYNLDADILEVRDVFFRLSGSDTLLEPMTLREYMEISDKDQAGPPSRYYVDYALSYPVIYPWPLYGSTGGTLHYTKIRRLQDFSASTDNPDFPVRWYRALYLNLALDLAPIWGKAIPADLATMATIAKAEAKGGSTESADIILTVRMR